MSEPKISFEMRKIELPLDAILPVRQVKDAQLKTGGYKTIVSAIREMGLIEPLMVHPQKGKAGTYLLVDGHMRYFALKQLGKTSADCIVAKDDESFTYNAKVSRLAPIQEHRMIVKAVKDGVSPERIAAVLNMPLKVVHAIMNLLKGIHAEAADILKDKMISPKVIRLLKKVNGVRQIEIAELMASTNNFTAGYAEALILGTPKDQLTDPDDAKNKPGMSAEQIARMEEEMAGTVREFKAITDLYGENVMNLTVARGYIKKLLDNAKVVRFLNANYSDVLTGLESMMAAEAL